MTGLSLGLGLSLAPNAGGGDAAWTPAELFASGEEGAWYEPSPSTCFTDAGTTPAGVGDAVYQMNDLSGNGRHAIQATAASRPILRQAGGLYYLEFDGTADCMATAAIDFTGTDKVSIFAGVEKGSETQTGVLLELSATVATSGTFLAAVNGSSGTVDYSFEGHGDAAIIATHKVSSNDSQAATVVLTGTGDISGDSNILRLNGTQIGEATANQGAGNYANEPLNIGARNGSSVFFDGNLFGLIVRGAASTAQEISDAEAYVADLTGVAL